MNFWSWTKTVKLYALYWGDTLLSISITDIVNLPVYFGLNVKVLSKKVANVRALPRLLSIDTISFSKSVNGGNVYVYY